jgi:hypothetical protein
LFHNALERQSDQEEVNAVVDIGTFLIAWGVAGVILFFWTGLSQNLIPWGTKSVESITDPEESRRIGAQLAQGKPNRMMYVQHAEVVAAFVAMRPGAYYSTGRFFAIEFITQLLAGAVLVGVLALTAAYPTPTRLVIVALVGLASVISVDLQYWNWWGFSTLYTIGVAVNRIVGYLLAAVVVSLLFIR